MKVENYVCYKDKYDNIKSLGVEIDSILLNDKRSLNNSNDFIGGGKDKSKKLFRANLGVPLPLLLIQEEAEKIYNTIHGDSNTKQDKQEKKNKKDKKKSEKITCVSNNLFNHLIDLQREGKKNKKQTRKNKKKNKRKTRKKEFKLM